MMWILKRFLVSFPHLNHHNNIYKINFLIFINKIIKEKQFNKISHIDFNDFNYSDYKIKNIYIEGDPSSHLEDTYHEKIFTRTLVNKLNAYFNKT